MLFQRLFEPDKKNINNNLRTCLNIWQENWKTGKKMRTYWQKKIGISLQKLILVEPLCTPVCMPALPWLAVRDWVWRCVCVDSLLPRPQSCSPQGSDYYRAMYHFSAVDPGERERAVERVRKKERERETKTETSILLFFHHWRLLSFL